MLNRNTGPTGYRPHSSRRTSGAPGRRGKPCSAMPVWRPGSSPWWLSDKSQAHRLHADTHTHAYTPQPCSAHCGRQRASLRQERDFCGTQQTRRRKVDSKDGDNPDKKARQHTSITSAKSWNTHSTARARKLPPGARRLRSVRWHTSSPNRGTCANAASAT